MRKWEGHGGQWIWSPGFSPDGKMVVVATDGNAQIWDVESGEEILKLSREDCYARSIAFSPDGKKIVVLVQKHPSSSSLYILNTIGISDISALPQQWADTQKRREAEQKASNVILRTERQKSGLNDLGEFLRFGNVELRDKLEAVKADPFDKAEVQAKIDALKTEIAQKKFYDEFYYSAPTGGVRVEGNKTTFSMRIETGFGSPEVGEVRFPTQGITGESYIRKTDVSFASNMIGRTEIIHSDPWLVLTVRGNTEIIRDMVRNSDNYRARVWFTNLHLEPRASYSTADVLKIEIIKVQ